MTELDDLTDRVAELEAELAASIRRECTALCDDVEHERDQLNIALAEAKAEAERWERHCLDLGFALAQLLTNTDGEPLDDDAELPVGEIRRALAEVDALGVGSSAASSNETGPGVEARPLTDLIGLDPDFTGGLSTEEHLVSQQCSWYEQCKERDELIADFERALSALKSEVLALEAARDEVLAALELADDEDFAERIRAIYAHVAPTNSQTWEQETPACSCPEVWAGTHRTGGRNLSPSCARHGEGTQYWRDFWAAQAAQGSPRERAEKSRAERLAAASRAGQAGGEDANG